MLKLILFISKIKIRPIGLELDEVICIKFEDLLCLRTLLILNTKVIRQK